MQQLGRAQAESPKHLSPVPSSRLIAAYVLSGDQRVERNSKLTDTLTEKSIRNVGEDQERFVESVEAAQKK